MMSANLSPLLLYLEDEPLIREIAVETLEEAGFRVLAFGSGREGLVALADRCADFSAVVTDIDMGAGPDGWEVAYQARALNPGMPIFYVSGGSTGSWPSMGVANSVMIAKPYANAQLVAAVFTAVGTATAPILPPPLARSHCH